MTKDEHRARHVELHNALDELVADYLRHNPTALPSRAAVADLMAWSHQQTIQPTMDRAHPHTDEP